MTRRRPSAWPTVIGALALFVVVFQLIAFQPTVGQINARPSTPKVKQVAVAAPQLQAPATVVSSTS